MFAEYKRVIGVFLLAGILHPLFSQTQEWVYTYNGSTDEHDRFNSIVYGGDGNIYVSGFSDVQWPSLPGDFIIVSFDTSGTERWFYRQAFGSASYPASKIIWAGDGNIYAGTSNFVISLTPSGTERWVYSDASSVNSIDYGSDGNLYIASGNDVISLTTGGVERWVYPGIGYGYDIVYGSDGNIYIASKKDDKFTVVSLTSGGNERWIYSYNGPLDDDYAKSIVFGSDGNIYAAGKIRTDHYSDLFVVSLTPSNVERWTYIYSGPGAYWDYAADMTMGLDGNLYVTGKGGYGGSQGDIIILSFTPLGNRRWLYNYNGPGGSSDCAYAVSYGLDGNIYVSGESVGFGSYDAVAISLTPFGNKRWVYRYNGGDEDASWSSIYGSDGRLYICGDTYRNIPTFNADLLLIKVNPGATGVSDISTNPAELIFDFSSKDYQDSWCPSETRVSSVVPIAQDLIEKLENLPAYELIPIIILMSEQLNTTALQDQIRDLPKTERRSFVTSKAKSLAQRTQEQILSFLDVKKSEGKANDISSLWIVNSISAEASSDVIRELSKMPGVCQLWFDGDYFHALEDIGPKRKIITRDIAWGVEKIRANDVWNNLGYTGKGIIVGVLDTGVRWSHHDLEDHMWDGGTLYPHHGWNFVSDHNSPADDNGHGTHVAGTIAGDGTSGTQTGVAPDAQIMVLKILNSSGSGSLSDMAKAVQFAVDHNADIVNVSVGSANPSDGTKDYCRDMCNMAYAADLPMAIAAGNGDGAGGHFAIPYDIYTPGDVPAPWYGSTGHSASMTVGATDNNDIIAGFSSYGPTQWNTSIYADYLYPPGLIKPDVSAPGVNITSLLHTSASGYTIKSGTSMATPHLAGTIALILEKNPFLTCSQIDSIIENFGVVDLGNPGKDTYYGAGRLDAYDAVEAVQATVAEKGVFYIRNAASATGNLEFDELSWQANWITEAIPASYAVGPGESTVVKVYVDTSGLASGTYWDTLRIYSNDPNENPYSEPVCLITGIVGIEETEKTSQLPMANTLYHTSPNPFRSATQINYSVANESKVKLVVYNVLGQQIKTLVNKKLLRGHYETTWDAKDDKGRKMSDGIYFVRLESEGFKQTQKVILLK